MRCPFCNSNDTVVKDSRTYEATIKRRRECNSCHNRFNTFEVYESIPIMVIKKDGSRQKYDKSKIERGVLQAPHKRQASGEVVNKLIQNVENRIFNTDRKDCEIASSLIGDIVLEELKKVDDVAFIRFASVYNDFNDIDTFRRELDRLSK